MDDATDGPAQPGDLERLARRVSAIAPSPAASLKGDRNSRVLVARRHRRKRRSPWPTDQSGDRRPDRNADARRPDPSGRPGAAPTLRGSPWPASRGRRTRLRSSGRGAPAAWVRSSPSSPRGRRHPARPDTSRLAPLSPSPKGAHRPNCGLIRDLGRKRRPGTRRGNGYRTAQEKCRPDRRVTGGCGRDRRGSRRLRRNNSSNPAKDDVTVQACNADPAGGKPTASGQILNNTSKASNYVIRMNSSTPRATRSQRVSTPSTTWSPRRRRHGRWPAPATRTGPVRCELTGVSRTHIPGQ